MKVFVDSVQLTLDKGSNRGVRWLDGNPVNGFQICLIQNLSI